MHIIGHHEAPVILSVSLCAIMCHAKVSVTLICVLSVTIIVLMHGTLKCRTLTSEYIELGLNLLPLSLLKHKNNYKNTYGQIFGAVPCTEKAKRLKFLYIYH